MTLPTPTHTLQQTQRTLINGSRWYRCDFHVHGPKSECYSDKTDSAESWLRTAIQRDLDCIAITDHNSGEWIDELQSTLARLRDEEGVCLVLFPGVELKVHGGYHLIVLFDPTKNRDHVKTFLAVAGISNENQGSSQVESHEIDTVLSAVKEYEGIAILAHINDANGLLRVSSGTTRCDVIKHQDICGIEWREIHNCGCYRVDLSSGDTAQEELARQAFAEARSQLDSYITQRGGPIAQLSFSDNPSTGSGHGLTGIGGQSTWVKMSRPDKEGLWLALHDGALCCQPYEPLNSQPNKYRHSIIRSITIERMQYSGLRAPLCVNFSPWLTTIIGGRGSGKSSVLECLRIGLDRSDDLSALGQRSTVRAAFDDFRKMYDSSSGLGALRIDTTITIYFEKDEQIFKINWRHGQPPITSIQRINGDEIVVEEPGTPSSRFPISIYSQKQMYEMARNTASLLEVIDQSAEVDYQEWKNRWDTKVADFMAACASERRLAQIHQSLSEAQGQLNDIENKIALLESDENRQILHARQTAEQQQQEISGVLRALDKMPDSLKGVVDELDIPSLSTEAWANIPQVLSAHTEAIQQIARIQTEIRDSIEKMKVVNIEFLSSLMTSGWDNQYIQTCSSYEDLVTDLRSKGVAGVDEYEVYLRQRTALQARIAGIQEEAATLLETASQASALRCDLANLRLALSQKRKAFAESLNQRLTGLRVEIDILGDHEDWEGILRDAISAPREFESTLTPEPERLRSGNSTQARQNNLVERVYVDPEVDSRHERIAAVQDLLAAINKGQVTEQLNGHFENRIRTLQAEAIDRLMLLFPKDRVIVHYQPQAGGGQWQLISAGSPGQKTAAILSLLLAHGTDPLVIDQPEDDLDNSLIYRLIVEQIKENKYRRQLIIVTHNPNVPVNGDSELTVVMKPIPGGFDKGLEGGLQENAIRKQICEIMEGGEDAFRKRYERIVGQRR